MDIPRLLRIIAVCLLISACGATSDVGAGEGPPADTFPADVQGGWLLVEGGGPDGAVRGVMGERVTLDVGETSLGGSVGCNSLGGDVTVSGSLIQMGMWSSTSMGCAQPLMDAEMAYGAALARVERFELVDDHLVLTGDGTRLTFERRGEVDAVALVGTRWVLESLIDGEAVSSVAGEPATLELSEAGTLVGSTGCRTLFGEFILVSDTLNLTTFSAEGECPAELSDQDGHVIGVLGDGVLPEVDGDRLTLMDGPKGLIYRAEP